MQTPANHPQNLIPTLPSHANVSARICNQHLDCLGSGSKVEVPNNHRVRGLTDGRKSGRYLRGWRGGGGGSEEMRRAPAPATPGARGAGSGEGGGGSGITRRSRWSWRIDDGARLDYRARAGRPAACASGVESAMGTRRPCRLVLVVWAAGLRPA
jgi:hypothetical protein